MISNVLRVLKICFLCFNVVKSFNNLSLVSGVTFFVFCYCAVSAFCE